MTPALQVAVVAAIVGVSALSLLRALAPRASWQAQARLSYWLERPGRPAWLRRIGRRIAPAPRAAQDGCGTCGGCGPSH